MEKFEILFTQPIAMKAGDKSVLIHGEPVKVDFRIIAEENYQLLLAAIRAKQIKQI
jgi:hypothetical protein